jgi:putative ATP-dependent endonuclease of OLD family
MAKRNNKAGGPTAPLSEQQDESERPRLTKLVIQNFGCIGPSPVAIDLNDIVVLVGANNVGKSTILRAYEVVMSDGSNSAKLTIDDFPHGCVDSDNLPTVELETVVFDNLPGERWIDSSTGEKVVKERWQWTEPGKPPKRHGFDVAAGGWATDGVPWGAAGVANSRRPQPLRVDAFAKPEDQASQVTDLLLAALKERLKTMPQETEREDGSLVKTDYGVLLDTFGALQRSVVEQAEAEIEHAESQLTDFIGEIFQGYTIKFDAQPEHDLHRAFSFFKAGAQLRMGPADGFLSSVDRQGSGARRALMWAAVRFIRETKASESASSRPHLFLLDEPELCLHPSAVRDACRLLYSLPEAGRWQIMVIQPIRQRLLTSHVITRRLFASSVM